MRKNKHKSFQTTALKLASPSNAGTGKLGKTPPLTPDLPNGSYEIDYFRFYESLYRKEVVDWQQARVNRHDPFNPITYPIQQLYKDALLDNHLAGAIENRILRVVNKQHLLKDKDGCADFERSKYVKTKWFKHLIRKALESKFYGYSAVFISDATSGMIRKVVDVPRENVIPERRVLLKNSFNPSGESLFYPDFSNFIIYIQLMPDAIGMLESVAPMTIFKRHSWASWDEFEQIFGVPIRIAKTMIDTKKHKDDLQKWLENMGTSSYGIFDKRVDLEIKESNRSDASKVFLDKINIINKEMSKRILGQTMTMDDGSSKSQSEVHLQTLEEITSADISDIEDWFNTEFIDVMRAWGYDLPEGYHLDITANTAVNPADKIKVDGILMANGWNFDKDYVESTYEVVLDKENPRTEGTPAPGDTLQKQQAFINSFFV